MFCICWLHDDFKIILCISVHFYNRKYIFIKSVNSLDLLHSNSERNHGKFPIIKCRVTWEILFSVSDLPCATRGMLTRKQFYSCTTRTLYCIKTLLSTTWVSLCATFELLGSLRHRPLMRIQGKRRGRLLPPASHCRLRRIAHYLGLHE